MTSSSSSSPVTAATRRAVSARSNGRRGSSTSSLSRRSCARRRRRRCVSAGTSSRARAISRMGTSRRPAASSGSRASVASSAQWRSSSTIAAGPPAPAGGEHPSQGLDQRGLAGVLRRNAELGEQARAIRRECVAGREQAGRPAQTVAQHLGDCGSRAPRRSSGRRPCTRAARPGRARAPTRRVLPMPASPVTSTQPPRALGYGGARRLQCRALELPADQRPGFDHVSESTARMQPERCG